MPNLAKKFIIEDKFALWSLLLIILIMSPLWISFDSAIIGDENMMFQRYEALRQTVVNYGQWPGLNPWNAGGQPLEGYPNVFALSIKSILVLIFGTQLGLGISIVLYISVGYLGSWLLASLFWKNEILKNIFAILIVFNEPLFFHLSAGHIIFYVYYLIPLLLYFSLRLFRDRWSGLKSGLVFGFAFIDTPVYLMQYYSIVWMFLYLWFFVSADTHGRRMAIRWLILFIVVVATIIAYQVITVYQVINEFPRVSSLTFHYSWSDIFKSYFYPLTEIEKFFPNPAGVPRMSCVISTHEVSAYLGVVGFSLVVVSLANGVKWWHFLILFLFLLGVGNDSVFHPMYWLQKLPSFSSHLCFSRVRIMTHLFLPFAIAGGLWVLWSKLKMKKYGKVVIAVLYMFIVLERLIVGFMIIKDVHVNIEEADPFYRSHYEYLDKDDQFINVNAIPPFEATQLNIGILRGGGDSHLPMNNKNVDGYSGPMGKDEEGYIAEFHQNRNSIDPDYWSPNKIIFSDLDTKVPLILNMNPSSAWHLNGTQLFPNYKIIEVNKEFSVMPNKDGTIVLSYEPPGRKIGLAITMLFFILAIITVFYFKKSDLRSQKGVGIGRN